MKSIFLRKRVYCLAFLFTLATLFGTLPASGQGFDSIDRSRMKAMLRSLKSEIKKTYYDPAFHGIDLEDRFKKGEERLDQVTSTGQALGVIAQVLIDFNDSHLYFNPPPTTLQVQYGWQYKMFGDKCLITSIKPGTDAEKQGVKIGDEIVSIQGFRPSKSELWKVQYYYNVISPRDHVKLTLRSPGAAEPRDLDIRSEMKRQPAKITTSSSFRYFDNFYNEENDKHRFLTLGSISVWKFSSFEFDPVDVSSLMARFKNSAGLIIDLRGNGGGYVKTMESLTGSFFNKDTKVADLKGRKPMDPSIAKTAGGKDVYTGKLVVLLDSQSASASEIFARVIQLEKRGQVLGDVSAGAVMQAIGFRGGLGTDSVVPYGASITNADVIMVDGKSLEHVGVVPDELILPSPEDVAAGRDPVLARAFEILGAKISSEAAGKAFPGYFWK